MDWKKIRVLMADKDIGERDVRKLCLPNTSVLICLLHTPYREMPGQKQLTIVAVCTFAYIPV